MNHATQTERTELLEILRSLVREVIQGETPRERIRLRVWEELDTREVWNMDELFITDCYYALKHMEEEVISPWEWRYFQECLEGKRTYQLEEKLRYLLDEGESG